MNKIIRLKRKTPQALDEVVVTRGPHRHKVGIVQGTVTYEDATPRWAYRQVYFVGEPSVLIRPQDLNVLEPDHD